MIMTKVATLAMVISAAENILEDWVLAAVVGKGGIGLAVLEGLRFFGVSFVQENALFGHCLIA